MRSSGLNASRWLHFGLAEMAPLVACTAICYRKDKHTNQRTAQRYRENLEASPNLMVACIAGATVSTQRCRHH